MSVKVKGDGRIIVEAYVEMGEGDDPIKYEVKDEHFFVKRILLTPLKYPTNYGYIPNTLAGDGDELDILILTPYPLKHRSRVKCRAIGALDVEDQEGEDIKILAVPISKVYPGYDHWNSWRDVPSAITRRIHDFFRDYKKEYEDRWSKVNGWLPRTKAEQIILDSSAGWRASERNRRGLDE